MQEPVPSAGPRAYLDTLDTIQYLPGELCIETSGYITSTQHNIATSEFLDLNKY